MRISTDKQCEKAICGEGERATFPVAGVPGLALRVTADGVKTWSVRYRRQADGKLRRLTLGTYPDVGLKDAKDRARDARNLAMRGADPVGQKQERRAAGTFAELAEQWFTFKERQGRSAAYVRVNRNRLKLLPASFTDRKARELERLHITGALEAAAKRGATTEVNRHHAFIRGVLRWAFSEGLIDRDASAGIKARFAESERDRVMSSIEWLAFWKGIEIAPAEEASRIAMQLVLLLGQRPKEIASLSVDGLNLDTLHPTVTFHRETTKNAVEHVLPIPARAVAMLRRAVEIASEAHAKAAEASPGRKAKPLQWVFPAPGGEGPMDPHAFSVIMHRARDTEAGTLFGLKDVILYDARRTMATWLGDQGHPNEFVALLLNHLSAKKGTVTGRHYNHAKYLTQKRAMMAEWAAHVDALIGDVSTVADNIRAFPSRAG